MPFFFWLASGWSRYSGSLGVDGGFESVRTSTGKGGKGQDRCYLGVLDPAPVVHQSFSLGPFLGPSLGDAVLWVFV